jgi:hypothetical protein
MVQSRQLDIWYQRVNPRTDVAGGSFGTSDGRVLVDPKNGIVEGNNPWCGELYSNKKCPSEYPSWTLVFGSDGNYLAPVMGGRSEFSITTQSLPNSIAIPLPSPSPMRR